MKHVRDFHSQSWDNPFFGRANTRRWPKVLWFVGSLAVLGGVIYTLVYSPLFRLSKIAVSGATVSDPVRIQATAAQLLAGYEYLVVPKDYFLSANLAGVKNSLLASFPNLLSVDVKKSFSKLTIEVSERQPTYRLIIGDKSYLLDQAGVGLRDAAAGEGDALIALKQDDAVFTAGKRIIDANWIKAAFDLHKYFATQIGIRDQLYRFDLKNEDIETVTTEGWYAVVDPLMDVNEQLKSLSSALLGKFNSAERKKLLYIDIRFGDKIYYKWK